jgi:hypothetical protein
LEARFCHTVRPGPAARTSTYTPHRAAGTGYGGHNDPTEPAANTPRDLLLPDILHGESNAKYIWTDETRTVLKHLLYDSEQSAVLNLTDYIGR